MSGMLPFIGGSVEEEAKQLNFVSYRGSKLIQKKTYIFSVKVCEVIYICNHLFDFLYFLHLSIVPFWNTH